jgi:hypothetical protein
MVLRIVRMFLSENERRKQSNFRKRYTIASATPNVAFRKEILLGLLDPAVAGICPARVEATLGSRAVVEFFLFRCQATMATSRLPHSWNEKFEYAQKRVVLFFRNCLALSFRRCQDVRSSLSIEPTCPLPHTVLLTPFELVVRRNYSPKRSNRDPVNMQKNN